MALSRKKKHEKCLEFWSEGTGDATVAHRRLLELYKAETETEEFRSGNIRKAAQYLNLAEKLGFKVTGERHFLFPPLMKQKMDINFYHLIGRAIGFHSDREKFVTFARQMIGMLGKEEALHFFQDYLLTIRPHFQPDSSHPLRPEDS